MDGNIVNVDEQCDGVDNNCDGTVDEGFDPANCDPLF
jgi:hypothetical protein